MTADDVKKRTKQFGLRAIRLVRSLGSDQASHVIGKQLLRSATSVGANYRAACRARSGAEFRAKLGICEEEADESIYWIEMLVEAGLINPELVSDLIAEGKRTRRDHCVLYQDLKDLMTVSSRESAIRNPQSAMELEGSAVSTSGFKLKTHTLGCKVNQYETEYVREGLASIGYADATKDEAADLCIVNTCTVTAEGDSKSRQVIRRMARDNPAAKIVVMGCYATRAPEEVAALPNVTEVLTDKRELPDLLGRFGVTDAPTGVSGFGARHRAYVKVQDGCLLRCSFCIIPHVRPELSSRPMGHIVDEVHRLVDNGYREVVLTGIHLGHYGVELNRGKPREEWTRLATLVRHLAELPGDFRIRLSSIEATEVTRELIAVMAEHPRKVAPHLHISMQSGSDSVLRRMKRRWGSRRFIDRCNLLKESLDRPAITTDVIVGFPGETEAEFQETADVCREVGFSKLHIFPFSARRTTLAAGMPDQIPKSLKQERLHRLEQVEAALREQYYASLRGMRLRVLVEGVEDFSEHKLIGTSCRYAPVVMSGEDAEVGGFVEVMAGEVREGRIYGESSSNTAAVITETPVRSVSSASG